MNIPKRLEADVRQDPAHRKAIAAQQAFADIAATVRADPRYTDVGREEVIASAKDEADNVIQGAAADLATRRQARFDHLAGKLPIGPNIPADASPADSAVLHSLYRSASGAVAGMDLDRRRQALTAAARDGDDTMIRALLTTALTEPDTDLMAAVGDALPAQHVEAQRALAEMGELIAATNPRNMVAAAFHAQAFRPVSELVGVGQQSFSGYYPTPQLTAGLTIGTGQVGRLAAAR